MPSDENSVRDVQIITLALTPGEAALVVRGMLLLGRCIGQGMPDYRAVRRIAEDVDGALRTLPGPAAAMPVPTPTAPPEKAAGQYAAGSGV